jgi:hypothetical protein
MPLKPGTRLGPYEVLSLIGAGEMGEVWKAPDTRLARTAHRLEDQYDERGCQSPSPVAMQDGHVAAAHYARAEWQIEL